MPKDPSQHVMRLKFPVPTGQVELRELFRLGRKLKKSFQTTHTKRSKHNSQHFCSPDIRLYLMEYAKVKERDGKGRTGLT